MLPELVLLVEPLGLQLGPDDLERVRDGGGQHARGDTGNGLAHVSHATHAPVLELLVEHVVEAPKSALLYATGQTPTK